MGILEGKRAIVAGAGQGIGRGIALAFATEGASLVLVDKNDATLLKVGEEIAEQGVPVETVVGNVRNRGTADETVAVCVDRFGGVDILVNDAQETLNGNFAVEDTTEEQMRACWESGVLGLLHFMQACFPHMKSLGGRIINLTSDSALMGTAGQMAYLQAKIGIAGLSRAAAREWGGYGINVNLLSPWADSPAVQDWMKYCPEQYEAYLGQVSLHRVGQCEQDIGRVAVFLAGPDSAYVTGQIIRCEGGLNFGSM